MQWIPTKFTGKGKTSPKRYLTGDCPFCGTHAKHDRSDHRVTCKFCNRSFDDSQLHRPMVSGQRRCGNDWIYYWHR